MVVIWKDARNRLNSQNDSGCSCRLPQLCLKDYSQSGHPWFSSLERTATKDVLVKSQFTAGL